MNDGILVGLNGGKVEGIEIGGLDDGSMTGVFGLPSKTINAKRDAATDEKIDKGTINIPATSDKIIDEIPEFVP